jgi:hypothetical protein
MSQPVILASGPVADAQLSAGVPVASSDAGTARDYIAALAGEQQSEEAPLLPVPRNGEEGDAIRKKLPWQKRPSVGAAVHWRIGAFAPEHFHGTLDSECDSG